MNDLFVGQKVIVRTYSAGVHFGTLARREGREVLLTDARRLWEWKGAFTLSAVAREGIKDGRISIAVPDILLTEAIEVIPCADAAAAKIENIKAHAP